MSETNPVARSALRFEPLLLLAAVREVAELAAPEDPEHVSTRVWDRGRSLSSNYSDVPPARRITEGLRLPWGKVRALAFTPAAGQRIALGQALNQAQGDWLTSEYSDFAIALIARRLGVETLTPGQFRAERKVMLAEDASRSLHGGQLRLPTEYQISALASTWDRALAHAGLRARLYGGHQARSRPVPLVEVLDRFYSHYGTEPTRRGLEAFARANGIPLPRKQRGQPWSSYVVEWKGGRLQKGLSVPQGPPPRSQRPDCTLDVGAALPGERRSSPRWSDRDLVVGWVARYLAQLQPGDRATQRRYADWVRTQEGAPWPNALNHHGGWIAVRDAAWDRVRLRGR